MASFNNIINGNDNEEDLCGVILDDLLIFDDSDVHDGFIVLPKHVKCLAHSFNLVCSTDLLKEIEKETSIKQLHKTTINKAKLLWTSQNTSIVKSDFLQSKLKRILKTPNQTRWNSFFDSLVDLVKVLETQPINLNLCLDYFKITQFTTNEIEYLKAFVKVMEPAAIALDIIQGDKDVYLGISIPLLIKTLSKLDDIVKSNDSSSNVSVLSKCLYNLIIKRFDSSILRNEDYQIATAVHPKFKFKFFEKHMSDYLESIKERVKSEYNNILNNNDNYNNNNTNNNNSSSSTPEADGISNWYSDEEDSQPEVDEFDSFFYTATANNIEHLKQKKYSNIKELFLKFNSAMPSSASVERLFSAAKRVLAPERTRITDENFETHLMLHENKSFF